MGVVLDVYGQVVSPPTFSVIVADSGSLFIAGPAQTMSRSRTVFQRAQTAIHRSCRFYFVYSPPMCDLVLGVFVFRVGFCFYFHPLDPLAGGVS